MKTFTQEQFDKFQPTFEKVCKKVGQGNVKFHAAEEAEKMFGFTTDESYEFYAAFVEAND